MNKIVLIGIIFIFIGFLLIFINSLKSEKIETRGAVIGFIGPIPFGFGSDKQMIYFSLIISIIIILSIIISRIFFKI